MSPLVVGVTIEQGRAFPHPPHVSSPTNIPAPYPGIHITQALLGDTLQPLQPLVLFNSATFNLSNHALLQASRGVQTRPLLSGCSLYFLAGPDPLREEPLRTAQVSELQTCVHPDVVLVATAKAT